MSFRQLAEPAVINKLKSLRQYYENEYIRYNAQLELHPYNATRRSYKYLEYIKTTNIELYTLLYESKVSIVDIFYYNGGLRDDEYKDTILVLEYIGKYYCFNLIEWHDLVTSFHNLERSIDISHNKYTFKDVISSVQNYTNNTTTAYTMLVTLAQYLLTSCSDDIEAANFNDNLDCMNQLKAQYSNDQKYVVDDDNAVFYTAHEDGLKFKLDFEN